MEEMKKVREYSNKKSRFKMIVAFLFLLFSISVYFYFSLKETIDDYNYITQSLKKGDLTVYVSSTGYIQPIETVDVGSEVSGTIAKIFVDYNDVIKKGDILAQLNKIKYVSLVNQSNASLNSAKARLKNMEALLFAAKAIITRNEKLKTYTNNALPSPKDWDRDYSNYLSAKAQVESAKAQVEQSRQVFISSKYDLDKTSIYSPIDGTILEKSIDEGQTVAASFQTPVLFKIAKDLTKMELQTNIDEADIAGIKAQQNVTFSVDAYEDKKFKAKIKMVRINSQIIAGVVTYKVIININNKNLLLKPGMSADVDISIQTIEDAFIVPKAALLYTPTAGEIIIDKKPHIWILKERKPVKIAVEILGNSASLVAISAKQLNDKMEVITMQEISK
tara:strand:+ start:179 stop:1351 length:1173 start_codon:yes stop_codon:yes gene_type:complete